MGLDGSEPPTELSSGSEAVSFEALLLGSWLSSYSESRLFDGGARATNIGGGALTTGGTYSSNLYRGARSRGVSTVRGVSFPRSELTACLMSSSNIMLLLMLTLTVYRVDWVGGGGRGCSASGFGGGSGNAFSVDFRPRELSIDNCLVLSISLISWRATALANSPGPMVFCWLKATFCGLFGIEATRVF